MPQCSFQPQLVCETILFPHVYATGSFQGGNLCQMNGLLFSFLNGKYLGKSWTQIQNSGEVDWFSCVLFSSKFLVSSIIFEKLRMWLSAWSSSQGGYRWKGSCKMIRYTFLSTLAEEQGSERFVVIPRWKWIQSCRWALRIRHGHKIDQRLSKPSANTSS